MTTTNSKAAAPSVSTAVAQREQGPASLVQTYRNDFATVLPSHVRPDTWVRLAVGALRRDPKLAQAATNDPGSLMAALLHAARLGLEPGTEQYYLTPRQEKGQWKVLGITGYQGLVELIYRAGAVSSVIVEVVKDKDEFSYFPGRDTRPQHVIDWDAPDRGDLRLVYAYAVMRDGATSKVVVLNRGDIDRIKGMSQGSSSQYSPWQRWPEAMWMKSAVRQLAKWVPTSAEYMREQHRAAATAHLPAVEQHGTVSLPTGAPAAALPAGVDVATGELLDAVDLDPGMDLDSSESPFLDGDAGEWDAPEPESA